MVFLEYKKKIKRIIEIIDYIIIYIYIYIYSQSCKGKHDYFLEEYGMVNRNWHINSKNCEMIKEGKELARLIIFIFFYMIFICHCILWKEMNEVFSSFFLDSLYSNIYIICTKKCSK